MGNTPVLRLVLRNHFAETTYPPKGKVQAVADTGYDGFLAVPETVFDALGLSSLSSYTRTVVTADGRTIGMRCSPATVEMAPIEGSYDGLVETGPGIEEVLAGTMLLSRFKVTLNYCAGVFRTEPCK